MALFVVSPAAWNQSNPPSTMKLKRSFLLRGFLGIAAVALSVVSLPAAPKIGVLLKGRTDFWKEMEKGIQEGAQKEHAEVVVKAPPSEDNVGVQIRLLEAMAEEGMAALIVAPTDKKALAAPVAALVKKGVKVIAIDSPLEGDDVTAFVGTDQVAAGAAAGKLIGTLVGDTDEVAFFKASETQSGGATEQREAGATTALKATHPQISIHGNFYAGGNPDVALARAGQLLQRYPKVKVVFASSTVGTLSMLHALQERKLTGSVKLIGFGYNLNAEIDRALQKDEIAGWIAQLPREVGRKAVETAVAVLNGGQVQPVVHTDYLVVTPANVKEAKVQALLSP